MARGKKERARTKKKGRDGRLDPSAPVGQQVKNSDAPTRAEFPPTGPDPARHASPLESANTDPKPARSMMENIKESVYVRYKESTQRIKEGLQALVPKGFFSSDKVDALIEATDYIVEHDISVEHDLLNDLKQAIRVRRRIALEKYAGGDEGHAYFIEVLVYCWSHLVSRRKKPAVTTSASKQEPSATALRNSFAQLSTDKNDTDSESDTEFEDVSPQITTTAAKPSNVSRKQKSKRKPVLTKVDSRIESNAEDESGAEEESNADDDSDLPTTPQPRPVDTVPAGLTFEDLISSSDRNNVISFFLAIEDLMLVTVEQIHKLHIMTENVKNSDVPSLILIGRLMEVAVAVNFAIREVESLEQMLVRDHPHLNTVYRVLANLLSFNCIPSLTAVVSKKSPIASHFTEKDAVIFLGDNMECSFRQPTDPYTQRTSLVPEFLSRWQIVDDSKVSIADCGFPEYRETSIETMFSLFMFNTTKQVALLEDRTKFQESMPDKCPELHDVPMLHDGFIGKNRSIVHTIRLIQYLSAIPVSMRGRLAFPKGKFGDSWGDRVEPATRTQVEMDELLMQDIIPSLINLCSEGMMSWDLPFSNELLAGFVQLKAFVKDPEGRVSWALAFTIHAILTSIFELQGTKHCTLLGITAYKSVEGFMQQIARVVENRGSAIPSIRGSPPLWNANLKVLQSLKTILVLEVKERTVEQLMLSLWNPYCAGAIVLYVAYFGNLVGGTPLVDSAFQLRMTLHLYNALLQVNASPVAEPGCETMFDTIFQSFENCKAIWEGPLPVRGEFQARWEMAVGMSPGTAPNDVTTQNLARATPKGLSQSFRRICRNDFGDVRPKKHRKQALRSHTSRVIGTLNAMRKETGLLAANLISVGSNFNWLMRCMFDAFDLTPMVETMVREEKKRLSDSNSRDRDYSWEAIRDEVMYNCMFRVFAEQVMGAFDAGNESATKKYSAFMDKYLDDLPFDHIFWYVPLLDED